jgi:hypothetical protein
MPLLDEAPALDLSKEALDELASLALTLAQKDAEKSGVRPPRAFVPYIEQPSEARANQRAGVYRVLQAAVLLGYIEKPG